MTYTPQLRAEILQDRFGGRLAARLSAGSADLPYEISERLRANRMQALAQRKVAVLSASTHMVTSGGAAALGTGDEGLNRWSWLASALPVLALVVGMVTIDVIQEDNRASELAEVDVALLTDDLPPSAYADPGFLQFLRIGGPGQPVAVE